jgi:hypothetical protein
MHVAHIDRARYTAKIPVMNHIIPSYTSFASQAGPDNVRYRIRCA